MHFKAQVVTILITIYSILFCLFNFNFLTYTVILLLQLRQEKCRLEQTLEQEQECLVNKLMRKIEKLEAETLAKQMNLERLRREKVGQYTF